MKLLQIIFTLLNTAIVMSQSKKIQFQNNSTSEAESLLNADQFPWALVPVKQISPEIVSDLMEIADLMPKAAIDMIVAEHYVFDTGFRKAVDFLKSSQFLEMLNKLEDVPEVVELLDFLHILVPATATENDLSVPYLEIVLLEAMKKALQRPRRFQKRTTATNVEFAIKASENSSCLHSFIGAVRELLVYFPHDKYKDLINEKYEKSSLFSAFYKALRSSQFRPNVEKAMACKNLKPYIATLNSHGIDANSLVPIAFTVISWGPDV